MRTFAILYQTFWTGRTGRELNKAGAETQVVALYLISSPHSTFIGMYSLPMAYACHDLGMSAEQIEKAFNTLEALGFAKYDHINEVVFVLNAAKFQIGSSLKPNDNKIKAIKREFSIIPDESPLKKEFHEKYAGAYHLDADQDQGRASYKQSNVFPSYESHDGDDI